MKRIGKMCVVIMIFCSLVQVVPSYADGDVQTRGASNKVLNTLTIGVGTLVVTWIGNWLFEMITHNSDDDDTIRYRQLESKVNGMMEEVKKMNEQLTKSKLLSAR